VITGQSKNFNWVRASICFVVGFWVVCCTIAALIAIFCAPWISISGQFGDTFGSVNALFTGLALIGVAYGVMLQRKQIADQEKEAEHERAAIRTQARELYLTARLNATVALLQAHESTTKTIELLDNQQLRLYYKAHAARESLKLSQNISLLLFETRLGFDFDNHDRILDQAIHDYLVDFLTELEWRLTSTGLSNPLRNVRCNLWYIHREGISLGDFSLRESQKYYSSIVKLINKIQELDNLANDMDNKITRESNNVDTPASEKLRENLVALIKAARESLG
jgi:hypothetical protein